MHPVLLNLGSFKLHTYGLFMGIGFLLAMQLLLRRGLRENIEERYLNQCLLFAFVFGILGARLLFVLVDDPATFYKRPLEVLMIWKGGLVFFGGFVMATGAIFIYALRKGLNAAHILDLCAPVVVIAHALGRLGCFMAGCCYGKACDLPWAVTFTHPEGVGLKHVALHPTQIYSAIFLVLLFLVLLLIRHYKRFHGMVAISYLALYPLGRSTIEFLRGDFRGEWLGLSTSQLISIPLVLVSIGLLVYLLQHRTSKSRPSI